MSHENPLLEVAEVRDAATVRVRLRGELDLAGAPRLTDCLRRLQERGEQVVLDLDELTFIDMSGLRVVLAATESASRDGWAFAVTRGSARCAGSSTSSGWMDSCRWRRARDDPGEN